ncbi:MAG: UvrD-helicase domain-containing protein [Clostridiaceae bacterium]
METQIDDFVAHNQEEKQYVLFKTLVKAERSKMREPAQHTLPDVQSFDEDAKWQEVSGANKKALAAQNRLKAYDKLLPNPYIGRIDLIEGDGIRTVYISEDGQQHTVDGFPNIASWTSAIGVFFKTNISTIYEHGGKRQEIEKRRIIHIENSELIQASDTYLRGNDLDSAAISDAFLRNVLKQHAESDEIASILRTVQRNQFALITQDLGKNLIIQGCAGSGKTMILLHRLVYLLQNFSDRLCPEDIVIIAPSDFFLDFTSGLSHRLGLEQIQRYTPEKFCLRLLQEYGKDLSKQKVKFLSERDLPEAYLRQIYAHDFWDSNATAVKVEVQNTLDSFYAFAETRDIAAWAKKNEIVLVFEGATRKDKIDGFAKYFASLLDMQAEHSKAMEDYRKRISDIEDNTEHMSEMLQSVEALNAALADKHARMRANAERLRGLEGYREWAGLRIQHIDDFAEQKNDAKRLLRDALKEWEKPALHEEARREALVELMRREAVLHSYMEVGSQFIRYDSLLKEFNERLRILSRELNLPFSADNEPSDLTRLQAEWKVEQERLANEAVEIESERNALLQESNSISNITTAVTDLQSRLLHDDTVKKLRELRNVAEDFGDHIYRLVFRSKMRDMKSAFNVDMWHTVPENNNARERYRLLYRHDLMQYLLCMYHAYGSIKPAKLICIDEAQNLSAKEYELLIHIGGANTTWNILGDVLQADQNLPNCTTDWNHVSALGGFTLFALNENYRNTEKITKYCNLYYGTKMKALGFPGSSVTNANSWAEALAAFSQLSAKNENAAILVRDIKKWEARKLSTKGIRVLSIDDARGTEFQTVIAVINDMSISERYTASTRALKNLIVVSA